MNTNKKYFNIFKWYFMNLEKTYKEIIIKFVWKKLECGQAMHCSLNTVVDFKN